MVSEFNAERYIGQRFQKECDHFFFWFFFCLCLLLFQNERKQIGKRYGSSSGIQIQISETIWVRVVDVHKKTRFVFVVLSGQSINRVVKYGATLIILLL